MRILLTQDPWTMTIAAAGILAAIVILMMIRPPQRDVAKRFLFLGISGVVVVTTASLVVGTIRDNTRSATRGPVHWHADFRVFQCGEELDLKNPRDFSNKVGTPEVHEHGDNRVHIEGTLADLREASLGHFFEVAGGSLHSGEFGMPTSEGLRWMRDGDRCPDGTRGVLNVFLWEVKNGVAYSRKLEDPAAYSIKPEALVPPGDCITLEFGPEKARPDYLCEQYEVAERVGTLKINHGN